MIHLTRTSSSSLKKFEKADVLVIPASSSLSKEELINRVSKLEGIQVFDANSIVHEDHVRFAFFHAMKSFEEGKNITKTLQLELLLRAAASRQITVAIDKVGVKDPKNIVIGALAEKNRKADLLKRLEATEREWPSISKDDSDKVLNDALRKMVAIQLES